MRNKLINLAAAAVVLYTLYLVVWIAAALSVKPTTADAIIRACIAAGGIPTQNEAGFVDDCLLVVALPGRGRR